MYEEADRALGRILDALPESADVLVVAPLGMGPHRSLVDILGAMLERVLAGADGGADGRHESGDRIWRLRAAIPSPVRAGVARAIGGHLAREVTTRLSTSGVDWSTTRAFFLPSDETGQIRLNVRGREQRGIVDPAEADAVLDEIADGLATFRIDDGTPAVAAVDRTHTLYPGARSELLPDLIVRWPETPSWQVRAVHSERYGEVRRRSATTGRNGGHTEEAWALVVPGASRGRAPSRAGR